MSCSEAEEKKNSCLSRNSCPARVGRIQHPRDRFRPRAFLQRADVVAGVELVEQDRVDRLRRPQPERIHPRPAPADDGRIERHCQHVLARLPFEPRRAIRLGNRHHLPAEPDLVRTLAPLEFPRVAVRQPVFRQFDLPALAHFLPEQPVDVADTVAIGRDLDRRHRLEEARRQPAEAAIAQRRIRLEIDQVTEVDVEILQRFPHRLHHPDIAHRIAHQATDEELEAEVIDPLVRRPPRFAARRHPLIDNAIADGEDRRPQPVMRSRNNRVLTY